MDLLGDVLKVPRQRSAPPARLSVVPVAVEPTRVPGSPFLAPGSTWHPSRRRLLASWLLVVASLWAIHAASTDWAAVRAWNATAACAPADAACLAPHDVTAQAVTARVEVTDHVARIVLTPSAVDDPDRESRTVFMGSAPDDAVAFARTTLAGLDLDAGLTVLRHGETALGLVDGDGTAWNGLGASPASLTLHAQWGLLGLVAGWFLVARRDLRPVQVTAVVATVVATAALVGASTTTTWAVLGAMLAAAVVLSRRPTRSP